MGIEYIICQVFIISEMSEPFHHLAQRILGVLLRLDDLRENKIHTDSTKAAKDRSNGALRRDCHKPAK